MPDELDLDPSPLDTELEETPDGEDGGSDEGAEDELDGSDGETKAKDKDEKEAKDEDIDLSFLDGDEEDLIESAPVDIIKLNKEYPKLLKDHPEIKAAFIREQKFTEVFPTIEDAQEAYNRSENFKNFEQELGSGQSENLLRNIAKLDVKAYYKFTGGILDSVKKLSPEHYNNIVGPLFENVVKQVYQAGSKHNDENLKLAAQYFSNYIFNETDPDKLKGPQPQHNDNDERDKTRNERAAWLKEKHTDALDHVEDQVLTTLTREIKEGIDPQGKLSDTIKDALSERVYKEIDKILSKDPRHNKTMRSLWERAEKAGFTAEWRNRIRDAYLTNAQRILPAVRTKVRAAAFKNSPATGKVNETRLSSGKAAGNGSQSKGSTTRRIDYSKTSDADIFNDKPTFKK